MYFFERVTTHKQLSPDLGIIHGHVVTDFGDFNFAKLIRNTAEIYFTSEEFKWILAILGSKKDGRLHRKSKTISVSSHDCFTCKPMIKVDFGVHTVEIPISFEERMKILGMHNERNRLLIKSKKELVFESERLATFYNWPYDYISKEDLAKAGFYYLNEDDIVKCHYCSGIISKWEKGDKPIEEHKKHFPQCRYIQLITGNEGKDVVDNIK